MILRHLRTVLWLRRRLRYNQARRNALGAIVTRIVRALGALAAVASFLLLLLVGMYPLADAGSLAILYIWDGLVVAFLGFWAMGVLVQLQRAELLSADRFLSFPIPPHVVFVINYLGTGVLAAEVVLFAPGMIGLATGLAISRGPRFWWLIPLVAAFMVCITALSYQFRGWLATLMMDERRRRHGMAMGGLLVALLAVSMSQLGFLTQGFVSRAAGVDRQEVSRLRRDLQALGRAQQQGRIEAAEYGRRVQEVRGRLDPLNAALEAERARLVEQVVIPVHQWVPAGWLPYGAMTIADGRGMPATLGGLGLLLIGFVSLRRSYRTTMRLSLGETGGSAPAAPVVPVVAAPRARAPATSGMLAWRLPVVSEHAAVIALAGFRSLLRAPEARLVLLGPLMMVVVFGGMFFRGGTRLVGELNEQGLASDATVFLLPLVAAGMFVLVLLGLNQLAANQFGFDRDGFRFFVLGAASRSDVLLGKNLALMPIALGMGALFLVAAQLLVPMRLDHFVATLAQTVSLYLLYCLVTNLLSIVAPIAIKPGSMQPVRMNGLLVLLNVAAIVIFPLALAPALLPLGIEAALAWWTDLRGVPVYLVLSLVQIVLVLLLYRRLLGWQGRMLQDREQRILEAVTVRAE